MVFIAKSNRARTPGSTKPRFPGFDVLDEVERWDAVTAGVILARLAPAPEMAVFTKAEQATAEALCDQLLGQHEQPRIPVAALVDVRLATGETDGWHYADMPPDVEAWQKTLAFLDDDARSIGGETFGQLAKEDQAGVVQAVQDLGEKPWHGLPAKQVWSLWTRYACAAFYSHPWAWNEIGFPGPAYPRGYKNIGLDAREGFEVADAMNEDPVPWASRAEDAKKRQAAKLPGKKS
ncbi:MAG: gluconate 2-dehydrogenase subunit 3 family protein [Acidothermaceae bacterium]